jgi:DNA-binding transcriptional LysR family regulator
MAGSSTAMAISVWVAERGSFANAAVEAGLSPSAVAKLIRQVEARPGGRFINRTTRRLALTT